MKDPGRFVVAWGPSQEPLEASAKKLVAAVEWMRAVPGLAGPCVYYDRFDTRRELRCESQREALAALEEAAYPLGPPRPAPEYYKQYFYLGSARAWTVAATFVCGARSVTYGSHAPNQFDVRVPQGLDTAHLRQILVGLVNVFRPAWAFCGSSTFPEDRSQYDGTPAAGFLTYLSAWFGEVKDPRTGAIVTPLPGLGTILQAHPGSFDPTRAEQRRSVAALDHALRESGALRPYVAEASA